MRQMLKALIAAIDAGETRIYGTVEKAERRLRELIETGAGLTGSLGIDSAPAAPPSAAAQPQRSPRPPRPNLEPAPTKPSSIRVIE